MSDPHETMRTLVGDVIQFVSIAERIGAAATACLHLMESLVELVERDVELIPEVSVAADHIREALAALHRAHTFADARVGARIEGR